MQDCRIRWGMVESAVGEQVVITSRPLTFDNGVLALGDPETERVNWSKDGVFLAPAPEPGATVAAHWDWVCAPLTDDQTAALAAATQATIDLVNTARSERAGGGL
jgi:hypothetical protein